MSLTHGVKLRNQNWKWKWWKVQKMKLHSVITQNLLKHWAYCLPSFRSLGFFFYYFRFCFVLFCFSAAFKTVIVLFPLLGLCWFFGIVGVMTNSPPFIYAFVVLSSLQVGDSLRIHRKLCLPKHYCEFLKIATLTSLGINLKHSKTIVNYSQFNQFLDTSILPD